MKTLYQHFLKSLLVGMVYAATLAITKLLLFKTVDARSFLWSFVGGTVVGLVLGSLAASSVEIFLQNFSTGVVTASLMRVDITKR